MEKNKTKTKPACVICCNTEGFMKKVKTYEPPRESSVSGYNSAFKDAQIDGDSKIFVHQICAISFPEHFYLTDIHSMKFEIRDPEKEKFTILAKKIGAENNFDPTEIMMETFGPDIAHNMKIKEEVSNCLKLLHNIGAKETLSVTY
jgi:hypothetical protein